jgi:hypothetical protein
MLARLFIVQVLPRRVFRLWVDSRPFFVEFWTECNPLDLAVGRS